ncbi:MAG: phosphotransferase [Rhodobacteraceae bacterium]|nr:phosphotransferase [Paracoccaceae bacterium]
MPLRWFLSHTARKLRGRSDTRQSVDFFGLDDIRPIGNMRGNLITNKAGRAVLRARYKAQDVKLYEAYSEDQARFIAAVSSALPDIFPAVLEVRGAWVIAEWVEGTLLTADIEAQQELTLRRIHALALGELPPAGFCYLRDFIVPRYQRAAALSGDLYRLDNCLAAAESTSDAHVVMHPDVSPDNLLRRSDGRIVCIDNELLCIGSMPLLDLCNALRPLSVDGRNILAGKWFDGTPPRPEVLDRLAQAWIMREAGSAFIGGDMQNCQSLMASRTIAPARHLPFDCSRIGLSHE